MTANFRVRFTREAEEDLLRLYDFLLESDVEAAEKALGAIRSAVSLLSFSPFACRKAASHLPRHRELVIPFGHAGYVALFEIDDAKTVTIIAVRHQREHDLW
jgi:plasmid stabilization system protein ParE